MSTIMLQMLSNVTITKGDDLLGILMSTPAIISQPLKTGEKNLTLQNGNYQLSHEAEEQAESLHPFLNDIESIAYGVEAWFEENTGDLRRVIESTLDIARDLGIPQDEIERWAASRLSRDALKVSTVKSLLIKRLQ